MTDFSNHTIQAGRPTQQACDPTSFIFKEACRHMTRVSLETLVHNTLDQHKAFAITLLDVTSLTQITDTMVVASALSTKHVNALIHYVSDALKKEGHRVRGIDEDPEGEWSLLDAGDVIVHVMTPRTRDFYCLETLWQPHEHGLSAANA